MDIQALIAEVGFPIAIVIYFILQTRQSAKDDRTEKTKLSARITEVEDYQKDKLEKVVLASTDAITRNTVSQEKLADATDRMHTALITKPCLADHMRNTG